MTDARSVVLIAVMSMAAEGTPRMTLALCREWRSRGVRPIVMVLEAAPIDLAPEFEALGIDYLVIGIAKTGYARYLSLAWNAFVIARRYKATALLSMPLGWHSFMAIGARLGGIRRVVAHVGNYPNPATGRALSKFRLLVQIGRPFTDRLICCSRYVQQGAIAHFRVRQRETSVVYNGVLSEDFALRPVVMTNDKDDRSDHVTIGMVARLEKHKDHMTLLLAAKILHDRGRSICVRIVGEGSQRDALLNFIQAEQLSGIITFLGMRRDVATILSGLDVFIFSTTADEGFGIALVEAMLAGIPIVASDVGACREVLADGDLGLLVPARDPHALSDGIEAVMADPAEARTRALRARETALRTYSASGMASAYGEELGLHLTRDAQLAPEFATLQAR